MELGGELGHGSTPALAAIIHNQDAADHLQTVMIFTTIVAAANASPHLAAANASPHLIQLVIDDLGWSDTSIREHPAEPADIQTPALKALADGGVRLSQYYVQPVCSPTRAALLSGRFPFRDGMQHEPTIAPGSHAHLPLTTPTTAELLAAQGYHCVAIGKWHQGYASWRYTPLNRGFKSFTGYLQGQVDYYNKTMALRQHQLHGFDFWHGASSPASPGEATKSSEFREAIGNYSLDQYREAIADALAPYSEEATNTAPLYMYLAMQTVHIPLEARNVSEGRCSAIGDYWRKVYCSMLVEMDDAVGELVSSLKAKAMYDTTLFLITTDNGGMVRFVGGDTPQVEPHFPASVSDNYPLRGSKATLFQGGVRGIGLIGGGYVPPSIRGQTFDGLMHAVDLTATMLGRGGVTTFKTPIDGIDHWPLLLASPSSTPSSSSSSGGPSRRDHLPVNIIHNGSDFSCVLFLGGTMKLIVGRTSTPPVRAIKGWFRHGLYPPFDEPPLFEASPLLFNLSADPQERHPLPPKDHPDEIKLGMQVIEEYKASPIGYQEPQDNTPDFPKALPAFHGGAWAPFLADEL